jgi:hypothetical protein
VEAHEKGEKEALTLRLRLYEVVPTEQCRKQHTMTETRDRKELGDALDETHDDGLKIR